MILNLTAAQIVALIRAGKPEPDGEVNVLALIKGKERWIYLYLNEQGIECRCAIGRDASNPLLSLSWFDAAVLANKMREVERAEQAKGRQQ